jgi:hypothetical protein
MTRPSETDSGARVALDGCITFAAFAFLFCALGGVVLAIWILARLAAAGV